MKTLWQDIRYGLRTLGKRPGFTFVAVTALALGIGANTAIFSVVNTVLLGPLPYAEPDRLVMVAEENRSVGLAFDTPAPANFVDWRSQNSVFTGMAAYVGESYNLTGSGEPAMVTGYRATADLFPLLGVAPALGRVFTPDEDQPGNDRVVVLGHGLWASRYGADPSVLGTTLQLDGDSYTVIGVMPPSFYFPDRETGLWTPMAFTAEEAAKRGDHYLEVIARLRPGVELDAARADMSTIAARLEQQYPDTNMNTGAAVGRLHDYVVGDVRPALLLLLVAVVVVLLIACANVANLLLARGTSRSREIAIRTALGAGRSRIVRQLLTESVLLAALGGAIGLALAFGGTWALTAFVPEDVFRGSEIAIDLRALGFTALLSLVTGVVFGLVPAVAVSKTDLTDAMKAGAKGSSGGASRGRLRNLLVVSEVALAVVLLVAAGLLIKSFVRLTNVEMGFPTENLLTIRVVLPTPKYEEGARRAAFDRAVIERVRALPGVESAGMISQAPLTSSGYQAFVSVEDQPPPPPGTRLLTIYRPVSPDYFGTMEIPVRAGRSLSPQDDERAPLVAVVNEAMARRYWNGADPIGKRFKMGDLDSDQPWLEVVGVAGDVRQFALEEEPRPQIYVPTLQDSWEIGRRDLVIRTSVAPESLAAAIRQEIWTVDPDQSISHVQTMERLASDTVAGPRFAVLLLGLFALVALALAAVGLYGVMAYLVAQTTHEIGIRMALGAQTRQILGHVLARGLGVTAVGLAVGLAGALAVTRLMEGLLFGVSATDPTVFLAIPVVLAAVALLACLVPARRASKVDPMVALRYE